MKCGECRHIEHRDPPLRQYFRHQVFGCSKRGPRIGVQFHTGGCLEFAQRDAPLMLGAEDDWHH